MSIYGLGGCGKTALALEFAYRLLAEHSTYWVFWVPAINRETFELAYREIGNLLRIPGIQDDNVDVKQLVKESLSSDSFNDWLIIIDNVDDTGVLFNKLRDERESSRLIDYLLRSDRGAIRFTTRGRKTAQNGPSKTAKASLLDRVGECQSTLGQYSAAETTYRQTLKLQTEVLGEQHPSTLASMNNLALVLDKQGKYEEAETMHRQTLEIKREVFGKQHPNTLESINNLAVVLRSQGKHEEAETMHRQTLELQRKMLGE